RCAAVLDGSFMGCVGGFGCGSCASVQVERAMRTSRCLRIPRVADLAGQSGKGVPPQRILRHRCGDAVRADFTGWCGSAFFVVEAELLLAGYGLAVAVGGVEGPLAYGGDDGVVDGLLDALDELEVGDAAVLVDGDVEDDVGFTSAGHLRQVGPWAREEFCERDADVAGA